MTTEFYIIRHAEAEGNIYRRMHGTYDSLITKRGDAQIERLRRRFEKVHIGAVYSSDRYRALKTASALSVPRGLTVRRDTRLREIHMGSWEDMTFGDAFKYSPEQMSNLDIDPWNWTAGDSEPYSEIGARFEAALRGYAAENPGQTAAVFSHGLVSRAFICRVLGVGTSAEYDLAASIDNAAVTRVLYDGERFTADYCGDTSHLDSKISTKQRQYEMKKRFGIYYWNLRFVKTADFEYDALFGDDVIGSIALAPDYERRSVWIKRMGFIPEYRGSGLGIQLIGQAVSDCRKMNGVNVCIEPADSHGFFEHAGFSRVDGSVYSMNVSLDEAYDAL